MHQRSKLDNGLDVSCHNLISLSGVSLSEECENIRDRKNSKRENTKLSDKESRTVGKIRFAVLLALFMASVAVCVIVYLLTRKSEKNQFEVQFRGAGERVTKTFDSIVTDKWGALGAMRVAAMAEASNEGSPWPFVTLSSFERRAAAATRLSNSLHVMVENIVSVENKEKWLEYVKIQAPIWMAESLSYSNRTGHETFGGSTTDLTATFPTISRYVTANNSLVPETAPGPWAAIWQTSPLMMYMVNNNGFTLLEYGIESKITYETGNVVIGDLTTAPPGAMSEEATHTSYMASFLSFKEKRNVYYEGDPLSTVYFPLFRSFEKGDNKTVATLFSLFHWASYFRDVLPAEEKDVEFVLENPCSGPFTYVIRGNEVIYRGKGDLHDAKFDYLEMRTSFEDVRTIQDGTEFGIPFAASYCPVAIRVYPTRVYYDQFYNSSPYLMTLAVAVVFIFTVGMFLLYDRIVEYRQKLVLKNALQSRAVVTSLFPENVADRLIMEQTNSIDEDHLSSNKRLKSYMIEGNGKKKSVTGQPIADLFPQATVLFTDIAGFTAWSSSREPTQVFMLLQTLYMAFDDISDRRHVFKVETIGDSYMAVTGLPEPQMHHALIMARFATEIRQKMSVLTRDLASILGPGTSDLTLRIGIHSGPVTAGVLRGNRARFQLFGDTVNTASRMESTGVPDKIQISTTTAEILKKSGKGHWVRPREDKVHAKGKGILETFWLDINGGKLPAASSALDTLSSESTSQTEALSYRSIQAKDTDFVKEEMMIDWVCEVLQNQLKNVLALQHCEVPLNEERSSIDDRCKTEQIPLDTVVEFLVLPEFDEINQDDLGDCTSIVLEDRVISELRQFVAAVAGLYRKNPFHNMEHACHVVMSVSKLLMRVVSPDLELPNEQANEQNWKHQIHDYTYGIISDPLANLAILFSAFIHDVDHRGVSNKQLIMEDPVLGSKYRNKSVAEQNALEIAWELFMSDQFKVLRQCIFRSKHDQDRFYQVMVKVVMATDIFDKELNDLRKQRWNEAFIRDEGLMTPEQRMIKKNMRATIVFEHLIQASDVAHTMQHRQVYRKWNKHLFHEQLVAFLDGRTSADPGEYWYEGELSFFDNYIIPLAKKLKECNVFGAYGDEYLNYAVSNRAEWVSNGQDIVNEMREEFMCNLAIV